MTQKEPRGWFTLPAVLSVAAGLAIFIALIWKTGPQQILEGMLRVGWMFPVIVVLGGLRFLARATAWTICVEPPQRLRVRDAFAAVLAGDALGNITPLGPVVGEPAKAAFVRPHLPPAPALTALAVENLLYSLATAVMIATGTIALLFLFDLRADVRDYSEIAVLLLAGAIAVTLVILWRRPALVSRWLRVVGRPGSKLHSSSAKVRAIEEDIYSFSSRRPGAVAAAGALEIVFHALGVLETHLTLVMILPDAPPLLVSFVLETASRLVTVVFKFVPLQIGVAEGSLAGATELLGMGTTTGVTYSIVRKARVVTWGIVGAILLVRRGITPARLRSDLELPAAPTQN
ncbi:MAG TPA: lysylphosphatidylglycerol synthase transmembrane domain-containing protein [Vicinamibacterales bacterium]|nr:lysylphosphatidylglycerol synthase transmembrane domain-containing protein [Vicinamibacterales bacterium]